MLTIGFRFPGGHYHATPWGRHVNEADIEWPPSPWRILRAFIAVWHRKLDKEKYPDSQLENLLKKLANAFPFYWLPDVVHSHVRHYMPVREGAKDKNTLIFDAFARLSSEDELTVYWPDIELEPSDCTLLDELLASIAYLGRAESWVEARRIEKWNGKFNCFPNDSQLETTVNEADDIVTVFCPQTAYAYEELRKKITADGSQQKKAKGKNQVPVLPESWLAAVSLETSELQSDGWSQPPAARRVFYRRPTNCLKSAASQSSNRTLSTTKPVTTIRFALYGNPLPRMEDAVKIGELTRVALMHLTEKKAGAIPMFLSGHDLPKSNRHDHAFFLSEGNEHGHIDHLLIHASGGFYGEQLQAMQKLNRLYTRDGSEWQVMYEGSGNINDFSEVCPYAGSGCTWRSVTPYLRPWHIRKNFGINEQIRRECFLRGLPEPAEIKIIDEVMVGTRPRRALHFYRFRGKRGLTQPDTSGVLLEIVFSKPHTGPVALGFGCHFGLGLFAPVVE
jgi:CRISPR-associated protein Csb2